MLEYDFCMQIVMEMLSYCDLACIFLFFIAIPLYDLLWSDANMLILGIRGNELNSKPRGLNQYQSLTNFKILCQTLDSKTR